MLNKLGMKSKEKMDTNNLKKLSAAFKEIEMKDLQEKVTGGVFLNIRHTSRITRW